MWFRMTNIEKLYHPAAFENTCRNTIILKKVFKNYLMFNVLFWKRKSIVIFNWFPTISYYFTYISLCCTWIQGHSKWSNRFWIFFVWTVTDGFTYYTHEWIKASSSLTCFPFRLFFIFANRKMSRRAWSGEYQEWGTKANFWDLKYQFMKF